MTFNNNVYIPRNIHRVPLATEPDMNCNNFNNFNTNGDIAVKFEVNLFYATMGLFAMLFVIIALRLFHSIFQVLPPPLVGIALRL